MEIELLNNFLYVLFYLGLLKAKLIELIDFLNSFLDEMALLFIQIYEFPEVIQLILLCYE